MEGHTGTQKGDRPAALTPFAWAPGWNSPSAWNKFQDEVGGHMKGGDAGVRLIEPAANAPAVPKYANHVPAAAKTEAGSFEVVALAQIFGGDELTARAPAIQKRIVPAHVALNPADATALSLHEGSLVEVTVGGTSAKLPLKLHAALASGTIGLPKLPGVPFAVAGERAKLAGAK
jgi:NADH-quinone oxidoreductase subunit G